MNPSQKNLLLAFESLWGSLWSTPTHLDSLLHQSPPETRGHLSEIIGHLLRAPYTLTKKSPWDLSRSDLIHWDPAFELAEEFSERSIEELGSLQVKGVRQDFPPAFIEETQKDWGQEKTDELVAILSRRAPLTLRISTRASMTEAQTEFPDFKRASFSPWGLTSDHYQMVRQSSLSEKGLLEIQDEGSQLLSFLALFPEAGADLVKPEPGDWTKIVPRTLKPGRIPSSYAITDTCAGAGGKTLAMADLISGKARFFAYDVSETKLRALKKRATSAGLNNIQTLAVKRGDEETGIQKFFGKSQIVLVDAPCSGWGVLRRNPDIKWRNAGPGKRSASILNQAPTTPWEPIEVLQARILGVYGKLVAEGGRLVYTTCTFNRAETTTQVEQFLRKNPDFSREFSGFIGPQPMDGFFIASLLRKR